MDEKPLKLSCASCGAIYEGRPSGHVCPDGKTYLDRIASLGPLPSDHYRTSWEETAEVNRYHNKLTDKDKKMLKGMKIKVD